MHGGLSPNLKSPIDIDNLQRPADIPDSGKLNFVIFKNYSKKFYIEKNWIFFHSLKFIRFALWSAMVGSR